MNVSLISVTFCVHSSSIGFNKSYFACINTGVSFIISDDLSIRLFASFSTSSIDVRLFFILSIMLRLSPSRRESLSIISCIFLFCSIISTISSAAAASSSEAALVSSRALSDALPICSFILCALRLITSSTVPICAVSWVTVSDTVDWVTLAELIVVSTAFCACGRVSFILRISSDNFALHSVNASITSE